MRLPKNALEEARLAALEVMSDAGVRCLAKVPVTIDYRETVSYCEGYSNGEDIAIGVGIGQVANYLLGNLKDQTLEELLTHEYGHAFLFRQWPKMSKTEKARFRRLFGNYHDDPDGLTYQGLAWGHVRAFVLGDMGHGVYDAAQHVSAYAQTNTHEDWAETFYYVVRLELSDEELAYSRINAKVTFVEEIIKKYGKR